ncbi:modifier of mdg4-like isoform X8 [Sitodiplosis mosellana]|uniref:modifier of mdg4-like isoform X8 n=1 Tax=Sitodiplosis mosellana TaxID=263140 RepID=UPI002443BD9D|nr:modifier of mdg4-like isoform X8 [Sitodiplosis mosellana]
MADGEEEQFSLCWNNYNTNLSTGFHESLLKGDLVDVTLAAEGHLVKAHRLVLSVCSPYFQKMFTQMPANQHAFVFLKDVPHAALKDLIQFMYCGEVNVKQDALPTFISTAEALQIKGLTENGDSQSVPASQTPSTQTHVPIKATSTPANVVQTQRPRTVQQRNVNRTASYKLDSEDSSDDKATTVVVQQTQKRVLPRAGAPVPTSAKRLKTISADPLEQPETPTRSTVGQSSSVQQGPSAQIVQVTSAADVGKNVGEPEFIDLPIETVPTKAEPDYGDEGEMEEAGDTEATYVEDESYGDMKYDESYFTESEETGKGASASGFGESYTEGDTSANEAQEHKPGTIPLHAGSKVYVAKNELVKIFDPKPSVYTCKLATLIFGPGMHQRRPNQRGDPLQHLEPKKLKSIIIHIMQIFQRRGLLISEDMIRNYLHKHIQALRGLQNRDDVKRIQTKRPARNAKENH